MLQINVKDYNSYAYLQVNTANKESYCFQNPVTNEMDMQKRLMAIKEFEKFNKSDTEKTVSFKGD